MTESSRPLGSSLGLLAALGVTSSLSASVMEPLAGGEGGLALTGGSAGGDGYRHEEIRSVYPQILADWVNSHWKNDSLEPMTGMDMPWS